MEYNEKLKQKLKSSVEKLPQKTMTISIDDSLHRVLKAKSARDGSTIRKVMIDLIKNYVKN